MKLITTIVLIMSLSAFSKDHPADCEEVCHQELRGNSGSSDLEKLASINIGVSQNITQLAVTICSIYSMDARKVAKSAKASIALHMKKYENIENPTPEQMIKFLNRNRNHMLCGNTNYMVESFKHGAFNQLFNILFYEELLVEDENLYVDINAISYTGPPTGKEPETTLDYMYRQLTIEARSKKSRREIQYLIDMFEQYFGGKRYAQLPKKDKTTLRVSE